jgi:hypothetical protein
VRWLWVIGRLLNDGPIVLASDAFTEASSHGLFFLLATCHSTLAAHERGPSFLLLVVYPFPHEVSTLDGRKRRQLALAARGLRGTHTDHKQVAVG